MKKINVNEFDFVVKHYKENRINAKRAWNRFLQESGTCKNSKFWKSFSIAASVLLVTTIAIACIIISHGNHVSTPQEKDWINNVHIDSTKDDLNKDSVIIFKFFDEPINKALIKLSKHYGKRLTSSDSTKVLSGEVEATSCEDAIRIIETTLDIKITVE